MLAEHGSRGLTHRMVERRAGLPDGTTSSYFPTRSSLLRGIADRVADLDEAEFRSVARATDPPVSTLTLLADLVIRSSSGSALNRSRARYELALQANRDRELAGAFEQAVRGFVDLSEEALAATNCDDPPDPVLIEKQAYAVTTFINGVMVRLAFGDPTPQSAAELAELLHALVSGIAAGHQRAGR
ncbi:TetR/AcrR family transcriptional regulator [Mycobacterium sp. pUA109]|uniref:TetR/AcrR family transcriptional regulator n=1 Tax=Mycobacterium sp. pUA109 TaxID=3238982 RepID=UPI00351B7E9B